MRMAQKHTDQDPEHCAQGREIAHCYVLFLLLRYLGHDVNGLLCNGDILVLNPEQENGLVCVGAVHRVRVLRGPGGKN
jgi:hypothetical protein